MIQEIKEKSRQKHISDVFRRLKKRWHKCFISEGCYFEGEKILIYKLKIAVIF